MDRDAGARAVLAMATRDMVAAGDKSLGVDDETLRLVCEYGDALNSLANMLMEIDHLMSGQERVYVDDLSRAISDNMPEHVAAALGRQ
jgi:hypothetical protein